MYRPTFVNVELLLAVIEVKLPDAEVLRFLSDVPTGGGWSCCWALDAGGWGVSLTEPNFKM